MVIKSLSITEDAYNVLKRLKHGDESFSEVIMRVGDEKRDHIKKHVGILKRSQAETDEMLRKIKDRRKEFGKEMEDRQERFRKLRGSHGSP